MKTVTYPKFVSVAQEKYDDACVRLSCADDMLQSMVLLLESEDGVPGEVAANAIRGALILISDSTRAMSMS